MNEWFAKVKAEFILNFIEDNRWKYLWRGLGNTLQITLAAVLIGIVVKTADSTEILNPSTVLFLKVGICGGFTTFSTFSLESLDLLQSGRPAAFAVYAIASVVLCVAGVLGGKWIAGILQA